MSRASGPDNPSRAFGAAEATEAERLIELALAEDLPRGDLTCDALFSGVSTAVSVGFDFVAREPGVVCGIPLLSAIWGRVDSRVTVLELGRDGDRLEPGDAFARIEGPPASLLSGERTALNFLQRLSGVATTTARWCAALEGASVVLLDTRKTTPGWRRLEKYAVRTGGGTNHRGDLSDGFLLKDNHAWVLRRTGLAQVGDWIGTMRRYAPDAVVEIEVDTREEFEEARRAGADILLLDNFGLGELRWAVARNRELSGPPARLEASGGIRLENVREVAETGVDRISVGALTHSVRALDIGLDARAESASRGGGERSPREDDRMDAERERA